MAKYPALLHPPPPQKKKRKKRKKKKRKGRKKKSIMLTLISCRSSLPLVVFVVHQFLGCFPRVTIGIVAVRVLSRLPLCTALAAMPQMNIFMLVHRVKVCFVTVIFDEISRHFSFFVRKSNHYYTSTLISCLCFELRSQLVLIVI